MWSGPRNISTALMRSFENRNDTYVIDEPFYAYYLKKTKKKHPLSKDIIKKYPNKEKDIIKMITNAPKNNKDIFYQKHMTHHILEKTSLKWISEGVNCFLIRDPAEVINSYIKKNKLYSVSEIGFPNQLKIFEKAYELDKNTIVINAKDLMNNPKNIIYNLCKKLKISYDKKMLKWPKGIRNTDGIWSKVWYENVINSTGFKKGKKTSDQKIIIPTAYKKIHEECLEIYNYINKFKI